MAKKEQSSGTASKKIPLLVLALLLVAGGWWAWQSPEFANWKDQALQYVDNRDIVTLEARFLPEQILDAHKKDLLGSDKKTLQNTTVKYYPYLLLDVKYPENNKTREGVLLWGLNEGEIVLNTDSWETTHGFRDCLECRAGRSDFRLMQALAKRQGSLSMDELQKELHLERDVVQTWVNGAQKKGLVVQKGTLVQLHFENPKILVTPLTKIQQHLVSKPQGEAQKASRNYSKGQIMGITQAAFGNDFKIRNSEEIFLPVYSFEILNPDGSIQVSEWNALTGQKIVPHYLKS